MLVRQRPADRVRRHVTAYWAYEEKVAPTRRREGPDRDVVVVFSFGSEWVIDGEHRRSFAGGLRRSQVTTEHAGRSRGMHIDLAPWAAYAVFRVPMHELSETTVPLEALLPGELVDRSKTRRPGTIGSRCSTSSSPGACWARRHATSRRR